MLLATIDDFPKGLRCHDCRTVIHPGTEYRERIEGMTGPHVSVVLVCVVCHETENP